MALIPRFGSFFNRRTKIKINRTKIENRVEKGKKGKELKKGKLLPRKKGLKEGLRKKTPNKEKGNLIERGRFQRGTIEY